MTSTNKVPEIARAEWQPIETAPDGEVILIRDEKSDWVGTGRKHTFVDAHNHSETSCQVLHYNGDVLVNKFYATHWMTAVTWIFP